MATLTLSATSVSQDSAKITGSYSRDNDEKKDSFSLVSPSTAKFKIITDSSNIFTATITDLTPGEKEEIEISFNYKKLEEVGSEYYFYYTNEQGDEGEERGTLYEMRLSYKNYESDGYILFPDNPDDADYAKSGVYLYKDTISDYVPHSTTDSIVIYTKPNDFYFNLKGSLNNAGTIGWNVSEGIQTVLPGLYDSINKKSPFNIEATKWKKWKEQKEDDIQACSAFSTGDLSAEMVNNAYKYLGASDKAIYKSGDFVSKQIFLGLEQIMNE